MERRGAADTLVEFSVTPLGEDSSVSSEVARCVQIVRESGFEHELHAMGTIVEGPLEELLELVGRCMRAVSDGQRRISCSVKIDLRPGHSGRIGAKVASVETKLAGETDAS